MILYDRPTPGGEGLSKQSPELLLHVTASGITRTAVQGLVVYMIISRLSLSPAQARVGSFFLFVFASGGFYQ